VIVSLATNGLVLVLHDTTEFTYQRERSEAIGITKNINSGRDKTGCGRDARLYAAPGSEQRIGIWRAAAESSFVLTKTIWGAQQPPKAPVLTLQQLR
jgi:hypothetical protein